MKCPIWGRQTFLVVDGPKPSRKTARWGSGWLHEIKHDGFRIVARKEGVRVRLYSRPGNDLTDRFPLIVEALARLRSRPHLPSRHV